VSIENVDLHETVQRQAVTDELTGLFNHRRFQEVMAVEVERAKRFDQTLGLIMLDIDDFKSVNDGYGHQAGDEVLRRVAATLRDQQRPYDTAARYGGEEFALILPGVRASRAGDLLERVRRVVAAMPIRLQGHPYPVSVTVSIGVASFPEDGATALEILACADRRLYEAKAKGRDRVIGPASAAARPLDEQLHIPGTDSNPGGEISLAPVVPPDAPPDA
jgi:diguanylate cyclase (GGDEF)-like protein